MRAVSCVPRSARLRSAIPIRRRRSLCSPISTGVRTAGRRSPSSSPSPVCFHSPIRSGSPVVRPSRRRRWRSVCSVGSASRRNARRDAGIAAASPARGASRSRPRCHRPRVGRAPGVAGRYSSGLPDDRGRARANATLRVPAGRYGGRVPCVGSGRRRVLLAVGHRGRRRPHRRGHIPGQGSSAVNLVHDRGVAALAAARRIWVTDDHDSVVLDRRLPAPA